MAVCQFFLKGQCRFGDGCRNEHPANARQSGFGASSWNRTGGDPKLNLPFNAASISNDLTPHIDKPMWPLSSYAPSKHEPLLIAGLDESPEELRVKAVAAVASGNINSYLEYEGRRIAAADQMFLNARNNSAQAYEQAIKQSELPARLEAVTNAQNAMSAFGNNINSTSALPSTSSAFSNNNTGSSGAFSGGGNNSTPTTNTAGGGAFSAFATQPSAFSLAVQNAPAVGSVFGQPSFGQPAPSTSSIPTSTSVFGNPTPASTSVFGALSAFGVLSQQPQPQQTAPVSTFATPSAFNTNTSNPVFGQSSFGNISNNNNNAQSNSAFSGGPTTTLFGNSVSSNAVTNSKLDNSTFTTTTPSISVDMQSGVSPNPSVATTFSHTQLPRTKSIYKPDSTPYDQQIPPNYKEALPKSVVQAFENQKFEWGDIPEWVPPVEVR